jgi:hypothetical protein
MNPRLLRPLASGRFAAIAKDASGNVIQPVTYTESGENYVAHIFNTSGTLQFLRAVDVEYLIVAGGGGGGGMSNANGAAGGGGGGGFLTNAGSPALASAGVSTIAVGAGGAADANGGNSSALGFTATGGGAGGDNNSAAGISGGSGGGGSGRNTPGGGGGAGTSGQGNEGGSGFGNTGVVAERSGGGGGGAGGAGQNSSSSAGGDGGGGLTSTLANGSTSLTYAAGGGGAHRDASGTAGLGVSGVSGNGAIGLNNGDDGTANRGGGGGGGSAGNPATTVSGVGGSGIVIVRYRRAAPTLTLDPDALAYISAVQAADNAGLEVGVRDAINDFIVGCKSDGIWDAIKASCILAGARTLAGALVPLKGTAPTNNNFVSGDYDRETGLVSSASNKSLDSNRANNADPQDSNHNAVWVSVAHSGGVTGIYMDGGGTGAGANNFGESSTANNLFSRNRTSSLSTTSATLPTGLIGINRSSSTEYILLAAGSNNTVSVASQTPSSSDVFIYAREGTAAGATNARLAFYSIGESLDLALLDTRVSALITAIGNAL